MPCERLVCHENLECLLSGSRGDLLHAISSRAAAFQLYRASLPKERLIPYSLTRPLRAFLNDDGVIRSSDFTERLTRIGATGFLPSYRSSLFLERWARQAGLELLSPRYRLQRTLEDKIRFHHLLDQHGLPVPGGFELTTQDQIKQLPRFPLVCQVPSSEGMEGTFLVGSRRQLRARLEDQSLRLPLLCREFIRGLSLGITIVVGVRGLLLSATRFQCRRLLHCDKDIEGVQWVSSARFSSVQRRTIASAMDALGGALRQAGFWGVANVDFILAGDEVFIIECNPRFSSSTPQLSLNPSLLHGLDFMAEHLRAVRGRSLSSHRPMMPSTGYEGAYVDFNRWAMAIIKAARRRVVQSMPGLGIYDFAQSRLGFLSHDINDLQGEQRLLFHYSTPAGTHLGARSDLGSLLTNFPLFSFGRGRSALTRRGRSLLRQLASEVRFARPRQTLADLRPRAAPAQAESQPAGTGPVITRAPARPPGGPDG